jgi:hypothetical protein
MNFLPKTNFKHEIKARIKAESKPELTSNIETITKKVVSGKSDVQEQEDYKAKDGFKIKVEINDGELQNGLFMLKTLKCGINDVKEVTKSSSLLCKPQTPENNKVAHDMEVKPKDFKVKLKDELMDDEFQNGLRAMETMKCEGTENKVKNEIKLRPIASLLPKTSEINENVEEVKTKPKEMKVKVEPKDEFENEELQSGLQVIEKMKTNTLDAHGSNNRIKKYEHALQKKANVPYQCCPFCGNNKFASREALKRHMMKKHSNEKELKKDYCFKCDKNYGLNRQFGRKYKSTLDFKINHLIGVYSDCVDSTKTENKVHVRKMPKEVLAMPGTLYKCFSCKKILKTKELLDKHSHVHDRHITDNPWFKCSICDAVFSTVVFLNQHVVFKHQENLKVV